MPPLDSRVPNLDSKDKSQNSTSPPSIRNTPVSTSFSATIMPSPSPPSDSPDLSELASSPTPTVRNVSTSRPFDANPMAGPSGTGQGGPSTLAAAAMRRNQETRGLQEDLGKGRPGREERLVPPPLSPSIHRSASPSQFSNYSTDDDLYSPDLRPRTAGPRYGMSTGDQTPRGGAGSQRGMPPVTSMTSSFGSPTTQNGSAPRPSRLARGHSTSGHPLSYPVNPNASTHGYGSTSRSASRARPALTTQNTAIGAGTLTRQTKLGTEDDDEPIVDRGEDLIRRRQAERKQARKNKERERKNIAGDALDSAGLADEGYLQQQQQRSLGPAAGRSVSRTRATSATRGNRREGSDGYFASYAPSLAESETPTQQELLSPRAGPRPASIYSSTADDDEEDEREREREIEEVVADVVDEATVDGGNSDEEEIEAEEGEDGASDEGVTLRDRQDAINIEHPFGLPIWKPALYRKSRSVTRNAESALHSIPSAAAERHLLPGNLAWVLLFGWWLSIICFIVAMLVSAAELCGGGRGGYGKTLRGLAWYIGWPFGKYVEGEGAPEDGDHEVDDHAPAAEDAESGYGGVQDSPTRHRRRREASDGAASNLTIRQNVRGGPTHNLDDGLPDEPRSTAARREPTVSFAATPDGTSHPQRKASVVDDERAPLLGNGTRKCSRQHRNAKAKLLGRIVYWPLFFLVLAPIMLSICTICWFCIFTIPMAKLNWALLHMLYIRPLEVNFRSAPKTLIPVEPASPARETDGDNIGDEDSGSTTLNETSPSGGIRYRHAQLKAGQVAPTSGPTSTVLLCTYRAFGSQYYKYTVGGVNILFINLLPLVFFTIFDAFVLLPAVERDEAAGRHPSPFLAMIASQALIFVLSLASVIPLSYFIGMAVASISAQSSIGMGAVINATFGSVIEIILYSIALTQGKGRLVEGSIVGSILAGVLLMPGASMCSGAFKRKEQKFNAKSAGVTSTMLIMAIIGTLTPTMFYQTYGTFELHCDGCPPIQGQMTTQDSWKCSQCYYEHPDPVDDPFYQDQVKTLMYCCAGILLFSYLIGLWFSLRTHASQIWQNPQQLLKPDDVLTSLHPGMKASLSQRMTPQAVMQHILPLHKDNKLSTAASNSLARGLGYETAPSTPMQAQGAFPVLSGDGTGRSGLQATLKLPKVSEEGSGQGPENGKGDRSRTTSATYNLPSGYTPFLDGLPHVKAASQAGAGQGDRLTPIRLPSTLTTEDFTRAVAVATVSALRHQDSIIGSTGAHGSGRKERPASLMINHTAKKTAGGDEENGGHGDEGEGGGHEAPEWTRGVSAGVLLACTLLYALIAEILVDVVDVVLQGIKIDEKFLGLTLFALVPNTTEFMNAMSFALNGNIALSMEIGSAYALQVCLLQIPAMVAFSAFYDPGKMGQVVDTFTLIFPRWDVIAIILSIFLLTYTYIEARSNYHRGSILVLAYIVLVMGFYFAPDRNGPEGDAGDVIVPHQELVAGLVAGGAQWAGGITKLWA